MTAQSPLKGTKRLRFDKGAALTNTGWDIAWDVGKPEKGFERPYVPRIVPSIRLDREGWPVSDSIDSVDPDGKPSEATGYRRPRFIASIYRPDLQAWIYVFYDPNEPPNEPCRYKIHKNEMWDKNGSMYRGPYSETKFTTLGAAMASFYMNYFSGTVLEQHANPMRSTSLEMWSAKIFAEEDSESRWDQSQYTDKGFGSFS